MILFLKSIDLYRTNELKGLELILSNSTIGVSI